MKKKILIIIGFAHLLTTPGKRSPDGKFREAIYSREVGHEIKTKLEALGYNVAFDYEGDRLPKSMQTPMAKLEQQRELALRVANVNQLCKDYGASNVLYVSGFDAKLDSIKVFSQLVTVAKKEPPPAFTFGVQAGYGITPAGMQPYIGLGVQYNFSLSKIWPFRKK